MEVNSTLIHYFLIILAISGFCLGWRMVTDDDKLFYFLRAYAIKNIDRIPLFITKPLVLCEACFASFWGSVIYWLLFYALDEHISKTVWIMWPICCISASFINALLWALYELVRKY
jgi:hypothetical protein